MVTLAPAIDACLVSTTRPVMREVLVCAAVLPAVIRVSSTRCRRMRCCMERPPFVFETERKTAREVPVRNARLERRKQNPTLRWRQVYAWVNSRQGFLGSLRYIISDSYQTDKNI